MFFYFSIKVWLRLAGILGICKLSFFFQNSALAQIIPDGSLGGAEKSEIRRDVDVRGLPSDLIEGGAGRGNNLFHSFSEFNVNDGQRVYFANPAGIENIISRVTGNNLSNILGTLGIDGKASLFFINPHGIIFGENAKLDIVGSFLASTAKSLVFENGFEFSTENPEQPPLLTINVPIGLQLGVNSGGILLTGSELSTELSDIPRNRTIGLIANGVISRGTLIEAEQIEIGSVGDGSKIGIVSQDLGFIFKYDDVKSFANILVENDSKFNTKFNPRATRAGDLTINGLDITFSGNTNFEETFQGGNFTINGRDITFSGKNYIAPLQGGNFTINGRDITFSDNSQILLFLGGDLTINGRDITVSENSFVRSVESKKLTINGRQITVSGNSFLYSDNSEDLRIRTDSLSVNGGFIYKESGTGNLEIEAYDSLEVVGVPFQSYAGSIVHKVEDQSGVANIIISTKNLIIRDGGQILSLIQPPQIGDIFNPTVPSNIVGSNISINATESIEVTGKVQLEDKGPFPSQINAASGSAEFFVDVFDLGIKNPFVQRELIFDGPGGNLRINTGKLTVSEGGKLTVSATDRGDAGTLTVNADSIFLDKKGEILATSDIANGGNINLTASDLLLMRRTSRISAQSSGTDSQDGNIEINTDFVIALPSENSDIIARSNNQGNIDITADSVIGYQYGELTPLSDITASGTLTLNLPNVDPTKGLTELPTDLVDPTQQIDQSCAAREEDESKFTVTGRGGLPQSPNEVLTPDTVLDDFGTLATREEDAGMGVEENAKNSPTTPSTSNSHSPIPKRPNQIVEAQGWVVDAQGVVTLVAQAPTVTPHTLAVTSASCPTRQLPQH